MYLWYNILHNWCDLSSFHEIHLQEWLMVRLCKSIIIHNVQLLAQNTHNFSQLLLNHSQGMHFLNNNSRRWSLNVKAAEWCNDIKKFLFDHTLYNIATKCRYECNTELKLTSFTSYDKVSRAQENLMPMRAMQTYTARGDKKVTLNDRELRASGLISLSVYTSLHNGRNSVTQLAFSSLCVCARIFVKTALRTRNISLARDDG